MLSREGLIAPGPDAVRDFLEKLVSESATRGELVIGEADPGRYVLVSPPLALPALKAQIDAAIAVVLERLGRRWPGSHVTDFGLRELYPEARRQWLAGLGFEALVKDGKVGVVTIFCHEWVHELCASVAVENGLAAPTSFLEYLATGKIRVTGTNAFQFDVFANLRDVAANFDLIDALAAKLMIIAVLSDDATLRARLNQKKP